MTGYKKIMGALLDGCGRMKAPSYIIFSSTIPGIAVIFLFTFILGWDEYLFTSVFLNSYENGQCRWP
jgi:multiple sugar transport system permease protein